LEAFMGRGLRVDIMRRLLSAQEPETTQILTEYEKDKAAKLVKKHGARDFFEAASLRQRLNSMVVLTNVADMRLKPFFQKARASGLAEAEITRIQDALAVVGDCRTQLLDERDPVKCIKTFSRLILVLTTSPDEFVKEGVAETLNRVVELHLSPVAREKLYKPLAVAIGLLQPTGPGHKQHYKDVATFLRLHFPEQSQGVVHSVLHELRFNLDAVTTLRAKYQAKDSPKLAVSSPWYKRAKVWLFGKG
jgi:hypothetical protein